MTEPTCPRCPEYSDSHGAKDRSARSPCGAPPTIWRAIWRQRPHGWQHSAPVAVGVPVRQGVSTGVARSGVRGRGLLHDEGEVVPRARSHR